MAPGFFFLPRGIPLKKLPTFTPTSWPKWLGVNGFFAASVYLWLAHDIALFAAISQIALWLIFSISAFIGFTIWWAVPAAFKSFQSIKGSDHVPEFAEKVTDAVQVLARRGKVILLWREIALDVPICLALAATGHIVLAFAWAFQLFVLFRLRYFYRDALTYLRDTHNRIALEDGRPQDVISDEDHRRAIK